MRGIVQKMAADGLRVLAVARRELTEEQATRRASDDPDAFAELCGESLQFGGPARPVRHAPR